MTGKCNTLSLDTGALLGILEKLAEAGLQLEGKKLMEIMKREVQSTTHGGAPGKPSWRDAMESGIRQQDTRKAGTGVEMDFGYVPSSESELVRAMIVTEGSGSAVGNPPITAGREGRSVWDGDVSGRHPSRAKSEYTLPDAFNQTGNEWVLNALIQMDGRYGERIEALFAMLSDSAYYGNVRVSGG